MNITNCKIIALLIALFFMCTLTFSYTVVAQENILQRKLELPIDSRLIALTEQIDNRDDNAQLILKELTLSLEKLNSAEQYLLAIINSKMITDEYPHQQIVNWLSAVKLLEDKLAESQLSSQFFVEHRLLLAKSYAELKQFKNAYDAKKQYLKRYGKYAREIKERRIEAIDRKYKTKQKIVENEILAEQNLTKKHQIKVVNEQRTQENRVLTIVITIGIVFSLLLVQQLFRKRSTQYLMDIDPITGLLNRNSLYQQGQKLIDSALAKQESLCVLMINIDDFSQFNYQYGLLEGDKILASVAKLASEAARSRDMLSRIGRDEFVILLPNASMDQAKAIAQRLREKVTSTIAFPQHEKTPATVSIGVANLAYISPLFEQLISAAYDAVSSAKANGGNQVFLYDPSKV